VLSIWVRVRTVRNGVRENQVGLLKSVGTRLRVMKHTIIRRYPGLDDLTLTPQKPGPSHRSERWAGVVDLLTKASLRAGRDRRFEHPTGAGTSHAFSRTPDLAHP